MRSSYNVKFTLLKVKIIYSFKVYSSKKYTVQWFQYSHKVVIPSLLLPERFHHATKKHHTPQQSLSSSPFPQPMQGKFKKHYILILSSVCLYSPCKQCGLVALIKQQTEHGINQFQGQACGVDFFYSYKYRKTCCPPPPKKKPFCHSLLKKSLSHLSLCLC